MLKLNFQLFLSVKNSAALLKSALVTINYIYCPSFCDNFETVTLSFIKYSYALLQIGISSVTDYKGKYLI